MGPGRRPGTDAAEEPWIVRRTAAESDHETGDGSADSERWGRGRGLHGRNGVGYPPDLGDGLDELGGPLACDPRWAET